LVRRPREQALAGRVDEGEAPALVEVEDGVRDRVGARLGHGGGRSGGPCTSSPGADRRAVELLRRHAARFLLPHAPRLHAPPGPARRLSPPTGAPWQSSGRERIITPVLFELVRRGPPPGCPAAACRGPRPSPRPGGWRRT